MFNYTLSLFPVQVRMIILTACTFTAKLFTQMLQFFWPLKQEQNAAVRLQPEEETLNSKTKIFQPVLDELQTAAVDLREIEEIAKNTLSLKAELDETIHFDDSEMPDELQISNTEEERDEQVDKMDPYFDHPISHYYIKGSHNTYLLGNQLIGESTIEGYRRAMANNCKCLELDLQDGPNGSPVIHHRWTMTSKIDARNVLRYGIKPNFKSSDLPLILSMDDNIKSDEQRNVFIQDICQILDEFIYITDYKELKCLPSPNELRGKIIIMAPRSKWGQLANICQAVPYSQSSQSGTWFEVSSLSENKLRRLLQTSLEPNTALRNDKRGTETHQKKNLRQTTASQLIRYYPGGQHILSGNHDPIPGMNVGCQIAAMNMQTHSSQLAIYESKFRENAGNCGYVLKPEILLNSHEFQDIMPVHPKRITIKVMKGILPDKSKTTFVSVRVDGEKKDKMKKKTKKVKSDDGLSPEWNEELVFDVQHPELGFALFQIKKSMYFGMRNSTVASYAIPIDKMVNGISSLILHDQNLENIDATLSVEIKIEDPKPEGVEVKGGTITIKDKLKELKGKLLALCEAIKNKIFALKQKGASSNIRKEHP